MMLFLLASLAVGIVSTASPSCTVQSITGASKTIGKSTYQHVTVKTIQDCVLACAKHPFCQSVGYLPGSKTGGTCLLSYSAQTCTGTDVNPSTFTSTTDAIVLACLTADCATGAIDKAVSSIPSTPNFLIMLADDFGYGDLASFGNPVQDWGSIDDMALNGIRFKQMYAADNLCSPSRVGLQSGKIPGVVGMYGGVNRVFLPWDRQGIPHSEYLMPERLRDAGYTTGMSGKWHCGINAINRTDGSWLPFNQGYDFVGIFLPFSNDWDCDDSGVYQPQGPLLNRCYMYNGTKIVQQPVLLNNLGPNMVQSFNQFMTQYGQDKWFFYFAFPHTHAALFRHEQFANTSRRGIFGDNMNEMNWAGGELLAAVERAGVKSKTLVVFTADHGPHIEICESGGVTNAFKGGKSNTWEGGVRVPGIAYWPGVIRPGQISWAVISHMDIYPTFVSLAGSTMPTNDTYNGKVQTDALLGFKLTGAYENEPLYYYCTDTVFAMRWQNYKFHRRQRSGKQNEQETSDLRIFFVSLHMQPLASEEELQANCPGGWPLKSWFKGNSQCNDPEVKGPLDPPTIFNLVQDPWENFPTTTDDDTYLASIYDEAIKKMTAQQTWVDANKAPRLLNFQNRDMVPCCSGNTSDCRCGYPQPYPSNWNITYMSVDMTNATMSTGEQTK